MTTTNCYLSRFLRSTKHDVKHELLKLSTSWSHWFFTIDNASTFDNCKRHFKIRGWDKSMTLCYWRNKVWGEKKRWQCKKTKHEWPSLSVNSVLLTHLPLYGYIYIYRVLSINGLRRNTFLENLGLWLWTAALSCDWLLPFYERNFIFWERSVKPCRLASPTDWNFWALQNLT